MAAVVLVDDAATSAARGGHFLEKARAAAREFPSRRSTSLETECGGPGLLSRLSQTQGGAGEHVARSVGLRLDAAALGNKRGAAGAEREALAEAAFLDSLGPAAAPAPAYAPEAPAPARLGEKYTPPPGAAPAPSPLESLELGDLGLDQAPPMNFEEAVPPTILADGVLALLRRVGSLERSKAERGSLKTFEIGISNNKSRCEGVERKLDGRVDALATAAKERRADVDERLDGDENDAKFEQEKLARLSEQHELLRLQVAKMNTDALSSVREFLAPTMATVDATKTRLDGFMDDATATMDRLDLVKETKEQVELKADVTEVETKASAVAVETVAGTVETPGRTSLFADAQKSSSFRPTIPLRLEFSVDESRSRRRTRRG